MDEFPRIFDDGSWDAADEPYDPGMAFVVDESWVDDDGDVTIPAFDSFAIDCGAFAYPVPYDRQCTFLWTWRPAGFQGGEYGGPRWSRQRFDLWGAMVGAMTARLRGLGLRFDYASRLVWEPGEPGVGSGIANVAAYHPIFTIQTH